MALYRYRQDRYPDADVLPRLGRQLGLTRLDHNLCAEPAGIAAIQVDDDRQRQEYIAAERAKLAAAGEDTLDSAMLKAIRDQASTKNYQIDE